MNNFVYLAGGHRSKWQEIVKQKANKRFLFFDPSQHGLTNPKEYTDWDLSAIRKSDIVFANLEKNNPSGYGLAFEIGYAAALHKHIIFIDQKSSHCALTDKYFKIVHEASTVNFLFLDDGIDYLNHLFYTHCLWKN